MTKFTGSEEDDPGRSPEELHDHSRVSDLNRNDWMEREIKRQREGMDGSADDGSDIERVYSASRTDVDWSRRADALTTCTGRWPSYSYAPCLSCETPSPATSNTCPISFSLYFSFFSLSLSLYSLSTIPSCQSPTFLLYPTKKQPAPRLFIVFFIPKIISWSWLCWNKSANPCEFPQEFNRRFDHENDRLNWIEKTKQNRKWFWPFGLMPHDLLVSPSAITALSRSYECFHPQQQQQQLPLWP